MSKNVAKDANPPKQTRPIMQVWDERQLDYFKANKMKTESDYSTIFDMLLGTGGRVGEVIGSQWQDFKLQIKSPIWSVKRTVKKRDNGEWIINNPKTANSKRAIVLPQSLALVLIRLKEQREAEAEYYGKQFSQEDYVFARSDGTLPDPHHISKVFKNIITKAGLKRIRLHDLRHTRATLLLQAGVHPKIVSERLGHASVAITLDLYSHVLPGMQEKAASLFDEIMTEASENRMKELMLEKC
ncbi:tyrosine-type recombinase/integrase [Chloroflexota bacterium]